MKTLSILQGGSDEQNSRRLSWQAKESGWSKKKFSLVRFFSTLVYNSTLSDFSSTIANFSSTIADFSSTLGDFSSAFGDFSSALGRFSLTSCNSRWLPVNVCWLWTTQSHLVSYSWFKLTFFHELDTKQSILCTQAHSVGVDDRRTKRLLDLYIGLNDFLSLVHLLYVKHEVTNKYETTDKVETTGNTMEWIKHEPFKENWKALKNNFGLVFRSNNLPAGIFPYYPWEFCATVAEQSPIWLYHFQFLLISTVLKIPQGDSSGMR